MGMTECRTWKQFVLQGEQVKEIVSQVKAEEKDKKPRPDKPSGAPQSRLLNLGGEIL